jgi:transposase
MNPSEKNQAYLFYVGVDLSKEKFDAVFLSQPKDPEHRIFDNTVPGIKRFVSWLKQKKGFDIQKTLICMEHTGIYSRELVKALVQIKAFIWLESSLQIKRSLGFLRGKNDKIDAYRIAYYAEKYFDKARMVQENNTTLQKLQDLLAARDRLKKAKGQLHRPLKELKRIDAETYKVLVKVNHPVISQLNKSLDRLKRDIIEVIKSDELVHRQYLLTTSVKGVGMVLTVQL